MKITMRSFFALSLLITVALVVSTQPALAGPDVQSGTTPQSTEVEEACTGSAVLNTGTSKVIIDTCPFSEIGLKITATPFGNDVLRQLPDLPTGLLAAGEGVIVSASQDVSVQATVCFPIPPSGIPAIYYLNASNNWVQLPTYQITIPANGNQFVCADGGLGTYLPVVFAP